MEISESCFPYSNMTDIITLVESLVGSEQPQPGTCFSAYPNYGLGSFAHGVGGNPFHILHEYTHCYNIADEYYKDQIYSNTDAPNCDVEGCPKWCSGEINITTDCYPLVQEYKECAEQYPGQAFLNCLIPLEPEPNPFNGVILSCDVGINCEEDVGCLFMCGGSSGYREINVSLMNQNYPILSPNSVSHIIEKILERRSNLLNCIDSDNGLNYYIKGNVGGYANEPPELVLWEDCCVNNNGMCVEESSELKETFCNDYWANHEFYSCPNGCSNGACLYSKIL